MLEFNQDKPRSVCNYNRETGSNACTPKSSEIRKGRPGRKPWTAQQHLDFNLNKLYRSVKDHCEDGRVLSASFIRPSQFDSSRNLSPCSKISIDLNGIREKIEKNMYTRETELMADFKTMFELVKDNSPADSQITRDANTLQRVLEKRYNLLHAKQTDLPRTVSRNTDSPLSNTEQCEEGKVIHKLQMIFDTVKNYTDASNRILSKPFINLPSKTGYPDYFDIIKKPIDMSRIQLKINTNSYTCVDSLVMDFAQLFCNACLYNEPSSDIYKDALTLHKLLMTKKQELCEDFVIPDVQSEIQEILRTIYERVLCYQDEDGRCYSDTFTEFYGSFSKNEDDAVIPLNHIGYNLKRGRYRRLDVFQEHFIHLFEYSRKISSIDSQLYEDSIALQSYFLKTRDELCKSGEKLHSPAMSLAFRHFLSDIESKRLKRLSASFSRSEMQDIFHVRPAKTPNESGAENVLRLPNGFTIFCGDFLYFRSSAQNDDKQILCVGQFITENGQTRISPAYRFFYPNETVHHPSRKFLDKEVFLTEIREVVPISRIVGRCYVMSVKHYFKYKPIGIPDNDVYVCEWFYNSSDKTFKKLKDWEVSSQNGINLISREAPLSIERSVLPCAEPAEEPVLSNWPCDPINRCLEEIACDGENEDGSKSYEQLSLDGVFFKIGDFVQYAKEETEWKFILEITALWEDKSKKKFAKGFCFVPPGFIPHEPTRLFYHKEILKYGSDQVTISLSAVTCKCAVLDFKKYCTSRPTEIHEENVYLCEYKFTVEERSIRRLRKGFKRPRFSSRCIEDEILIFDKEYIPPKIPSPHLARAEADPSLDIGYFGSINEDSLSNDVEESISQRSSASTVETAPPKPRSRNKKSSRQPCGYLIYASETRKRMLKDEPDASFGTLSKKIGERWRSLSEKERMIFEERAKEQIRIKNETLEVKIAQEPVNKTDYFSPPVNSNIPIPSANTIQYNNIVRSHPSQLLQRLQAGGNTFCRVPVQKIRSSLPAQFQTRIATPLPTCSVQIRSLMPTQATACTPIQPCPSPAIQCNNPSAAFQPANIQQCTNGPLFVAPPPKTQKLYHSEIYNRYINSLHSNSPHMDNWQQTLKSVQQTGSKRPLDRSRLPLSWFKNLSSENLEQITNALWSMRNHLLQDTLRARNMR